MVSQCAQYCRDTLWHSCYGLGQACIMANFSSLPVQTPEVRLCLQAQFFFSLSLTFVPVIVGPVSWAALTLGRLPQSPFATLSSPLIRQCLKPCRTCILTSFIYLSSSRYGTGIIFPPLVVQNYFAEPQINAGREVTVVKSPLCWARSSLTETEHAQWLSGVAVWCSNTYWTAVQSAD